MFPKNHHFAQNDANMVNFLSDILKEVRVITGFFFWKIPIFLNSDKNGPKIGKDDLARRPDLVLVMTTIMQSIDSTFKTSNLHMGGSLCHATDDVISGSRDFKNKQP